MECTEHGPESIYLCSSYFYMGELFRKDSMNDEARSYYSKIVQIFKKFILENDLNYQNPVYCTIDDYYYHEGIQHLINIKNFLESEYGPDNVVTAECYLAFGLVCLKINDFNSCVEYIQKAHHVFHGTNGEFDKKTKEAVEILNHLE